MMDGCMFEGDVGTIVGRDCSRGTDEGRDTLCWGCDCSDNDTKFVLRLKCLSQRVSVSSSRFSYLSSVQWQVDPGIMIRVISTLTTQSINHINGHCWNKMNVSSRFLDVNFEFDKFEVKI